MKQNIAAQLEGKAKVNISEVAEVIRPRGNRLRIRVESSNNIRDYGR